MKTLALITFTFFAIQVEAFTCNVKNFTTAKSCISKWSKKEYSEGEGPHSVGVSSSKSSKAAFMKITNQKSNAQYVAVVQVHYDEDEIIYLELPRGQNVSPKIVLKTTLPDLWDQNEWQENPGKKVENFYQLYIKDVKGFHL